MGFEFVFDYSKTNPEAHDYALKKLKEKFGEHGECTLLHYVIFYSEGLEKTEKGFGVASS